MQDVNHYETLEICATATQAEIKQAYRRLAKQFHPDSHNQAANHEKIVLLNSAYEILSDPQRRRLYDQQIFSGESYQASSQRQQRNTEAQNYYRRQRYTSQNADTQLQIWLKEVHAPVNKLLASILKSLQPEIDSLSADPFDDELMGAFQDYLEQSRRYLGKAQQTFDSQPNPAIVAGAAASLYYCLNQINDGLDELEYFTLNYDYHYLHTGTEIFIIANRLRCEAQEAAQVIYSRL